MPRPDQERFERYSRPWESMDGLLGDFAERHELQALEKNANRYSEPDPGDAQAILSLLIDIYQDDHWLDVEYRSDLPHSFAAVAFYEPPQDRLSLWKMKEMLLEHQPFSVIEARLEECLERSLRLLASWTPEVIVQRGVRCRNLKREFEPCLHGGSEQG